MKKVTLFLFLLPVFTLFSQELSNELIWNTGEFSEKRVSGFRSMNDGEHYTKLDYDIEGSSIGKYSFKTGKKTTEIVNEKDLLYDGKSIQIATYSFSADENKILLGTEIESIYRRSRKGNYFIYDISSKEIKPLTDFSKGKQIHPAFNPRANKVSFVRDNNLFITDGKTETQITNDGEWNKIINGMCDWVYEEEFSFTKAYKWSPSGEYLAFIRFDESEVKEFSIKFYRNLYPTDYSFKYPKAGEKNSDVSVHIYNTESGETVKCNVGEGDIYIPRITWVNGKNELCIAKMNRLQNKLEYFITSFSNHKKPKLLHTETSDTYVDLETTHITFLEEGKGFLITSERDGRNHIYHHASNGKIIKQITDGAFDVTEFYGYNNQTGKIFFQAPIERTDSKGVYAVSLSGGKPKPLTSETGTNNATFTKSLTYFLNVYSDAATPRVSTLYTAKGKKVRILEDNNQLKKTLTKYSISKKEFINIKTDEVVLNAWMIKPHNFDETKKYPVLMYVYNGPGRNTVQDEWGGRNFMWHQYLAQNGYIVVSVDSRGTNYRGVKFKKSTYKQLGKLETKDVIATAKYLSNYPFVDTKRIGIQGWSYGGYMAALCMTKGADVFKAGISVAPVTNWRYYDSIYTERFMRTPQENSDGYDDNSPINHVEKLKGAYLLVHGDADDNVHPQNTMEMVDALVEANKQFDLFLYPNKNHGIYGGNTRRHLYDKMSNFIFANL